MNFYSKSRRSGRLENEVSDSGFWLLIATKCNIKMLDRRFCGCVWYFISVWSLWV